MRFTRIRASRTAIFSTFAITLAIVCSMISTSLQRNDASAQGVGWLSAESVTYLTSSGIPVMVPGWIPGPVSGSSPEIYAGGGSYSIYFYSGSSFLYITGVAGGGFPGGSEANLNVQLSVNASVQGWPAIQDIGIPEGSSTPIYDKVMWIADGVLYTVYGNGLDTDSLSLANSSVALYPTAPAPTSPPAVVNQPGATTVDTSETSGISTVNIAKDSPSVPGGETGSSSSNAGSGTRSNNAADVSTITPTPAGSSDGTSGAWFTGALNAEPSDGTDGANPPFLGGDGTGGPP